MNDQPIPFKRLRAGDAFSFLRDGAVYVRCRGGFRPGCGGKLAKFNYPDCPVFVWGRPDPYQADEAAAFALMPQLSQPTTAGPTMDLFGIPADQAADLASRCASHRRKRPAAGPDLFADDATHECPECGEPTADVIGCPDGAEICRRCFDAGMH